MTITTFVRTIWAPVLGTVVVGIWWVRHQSELTVDGGLATREELQAISPYSLLVVTGFGIAIALSRQNPRWALSLIELLLVIQLLFWPARFSQNSWDAYLPLLAFVVIAARFTPDSDRRRALGEILVSCVAVTALLTLPALSSSGQWGLLNGKPWGSPSLPPDIAVWLAVTVGASLFAWKAGGSLRARTASTTYSPVIPDTSEFLPTRPTEEEPAGERTDLERLSRREREIYDLLVEGLSNAEIASAAFIAETTVKSHVSSILSKLKISSRASVIATARSPRVTVRS